MNRPNEGKNQWKLNEPPDRWLDYSNIGNSIEDTRFVCMKVPLKQELCGTLAEDKCFTPGHMVDILTKRGKTLGLLIDLTNTKRYYDSKDLKVHGVAYEKIWVKGHAVPGWNEVKSFCDIVERFEKKCHRENDTSLVIGVHCTHGVNRTGYLVCRYLIDRKGWTAEKAIAEFNLARGHDMERENYIEALKKPLEILPEPSSTMNGDRSFGAYSDRPYGRDNIFNVDNHRERRPYTNDDRLDRRRSGKSWSWGYPFEVDNNGRTGHPWSRDFWNGHHSANMRRNDYYQTEVPFYSRPGHPYAGHSTHGHYDEYRPSRYHADHLEQDWHMDGHNRGPNKWHNGSANYETAYYGRNNESRQYLHNDR